MIALLLAAAPAPSPSPAEQLDAATVTPGIVGFLVTFAVVLAAIGLFQLMTRSLRRTARNARSQGLELSEPARVGHGFPLPVRAPEPTVPGVLDGGTPFGDTTPGHGPTPSHGVMPSRGVMPSHAPTSRTTHGGFDGGGVDSGSAGDGGGGGD
ncbi:hypothetical protein [Xylanimonas protaetiae]|uniref:Uncharacterized protein n=1 Tax=Xylanimonas protaetiae TaxID=2509457 RepID=A0A4P6F428_9MICO|nr:hypothetical protein [Xylanimonas protaetiae]QAY68959.1 hypothetical protein ET471_01970 [Xylanimonas protaetiae]